VAEEANEGEENENTPGLCSEMEAMKHLLRLYRSLRLWADRRESAVKNERK